MLNYWVTLENVKIPFFPIWRKFIKYNSNSMLHLRIWRRYVQSTWAVVVDISCRARSFAHPVWPLLSMKLHYEVSWNMLDGFPRVLVRKKFVPTRFVLQESSWFSFYLSRFDQLIEYKFLLLLQAFQTLHSLSSVRVVSDLEIASIDRCFGSLDRTKSNSPCPMVEWTWAFYANGNASVYKSQSRGWSAR